MIVTGAAQGMGAALVAQLATDHRVVGLDVRPGTAEDVEHRRFDVASPDDWAALAADLDRVDGLVLNAGTTWRARLGEVALADWDRVQAVNTTGALLGIQALAPLMRPGASIVLVGSVAGLTGHYPSPTRPASGRCAGSRRPPAWSSGRAASASTSCTPATSRPR